MDSVFFALICELEAIAGSINDTTIQNDIDTDIKLIKAGEQGERNVYYELKNSFISMLILHNITIFSKSTACSNSRKPLVTTKVIKNTPVISLVVIANPRSIIDFKYVKKEIKDQIVKYDQLTSRLKRMIDEKPEVDLFPMGLNMLEIFQL